MDVKDAVKIAKEYIADVFSDDDPFNIGLEEVEHDEFGDRWRITIGFSRPWNISQNIPNFLVRDSSDPPKRSYRVVVVEDGKVKSVTRHRVEG